jgi:hypothetical protein
MTNATNCQKKQFGNKKNSIRTISPALRNLVKHEFIKHTKLLFPKTDSSPDTPFL